MTELLINGVDAFSAYGVRIGEGFLDKLGEPFPLKDYVTNNSRLKNGVQYCAFVPKINERKINLCFTLQGSNSADFLTKRSAFYNVLKGGNVVIKVPPVSNDVYKLKYTGTSVEYKQNRKRVISKIICSFIEPNPADRND